MKKLILGLGLLTAGIFAQAQNGLESIVVEKYYVSNAADNAADPNLPIGSVTYRIYADMLPGYKFQAVYGVPGHFMKMTTTTQFFNNTDRGSSNPNAIGTGFLKSGSVALDSWLSTGAASSTSLGVMKSEDNTTATNNLIFPTVGPNSILKNADASAGIPLTSQDGMMVGAVPSFAATGIDAEITVFDGTPGNSFITDNGTWYCAAGYIGNTAANRVLIAQITTDGGFHYELNLQIGTPTGGVENYVVSNPQAAEKVIPSMQGSFNFRPTVSIVAPKTAITGDVVSVVSTPAVDGGTIASVQFLVDGVVAGTVSAAPFNFNYTAAKGTHYLTALATDNLGIVSLVSNKDTIVVSDNQAPVISVSTTGTSFVVGDVVAISASASDIDGSVAKVEILVDGVIVSTQLSGPYAFNYTSLLGSHTITAKATDNRGLVTTSSAVSINVLNNVPPAVSITAPASGFSVTAPAVVVLSASASDVDGSVAKVEFFVNNVKVGEATSAPYQVNWTSVIGAASITAKATDNKGAITTSSAVAITIADPNALPYKVVTTKNTCLPAIINIPVAASDSVSNVIGYDVVMHYNKSKVTPNGIVTVDNGLINPSYVDVINSIDTANALINISLFFNATAPANTFFNGKGNLFTVQFTKTVNFKSVDTASFSILPLQESYYSGITSKLVETGKFTSFKDSLFNGSLIFWQDNSPIKYNAGNPNDYLVTNIFGNNAANTLKSATSVQPDLNGNFAYSIWNGEYLNIERDILPTTDVMGVINGFDAAQIRKVLVNDASFVPSIFQMIAMDVNVDGTISAGDVSQINQRTVLMINEFKQKWNYNNAGVSNGQDSKDWLFIDSLSLNTPAYQRSAIYPANDGVGFSKAKVPVTPFNLAVPVSDFANCPLILSSRFKGILLGDIDGNYAAIGKDGKVKSLNPDNKVVFDLSNATTTGNYVDVPVYIVATESVNSLDFALQFNDRNLAFHSVIDGSSDIQTLSFYNENDKTLRFTSSSLENYNTRAAIATVRFEKVSNDISKSDVFSQKAFINGSEVKVESTDNSVAVQDIQNITLYPNPASSVINLEVSRISTIQLFDMGGNEVLSAQYVAANQVQAFNIENLVNGVYMMKISNDKFVSSQKVVINK